jgi:hypothetical protein
MPTYTSYASDYDNHVGNLPLSAMPIEQQNELIRLIFDPKRNYQTYVVEHNIDHTQPDCLWTLIVAVGMFLERNRVIKDFTKRTETDCNRIIEFFAPTNLWMRLEEAYSPFDKYFYKVRYDWNEIEVYSEYDAINDLMGDNLRNDLLADLSSAAPPSDGMLMRLSYETFCSEWQTGRLKAFVDRSMAVQAFQLSDSPWKQILPTIFLLGVVTFLPIAIFLNLWIGICVLVVAIAAKQILTKKAVDWVRGDALVDKERFRFYSSRGVVWGQRRK